MEPEIMQKDCDVTYEALMDLMVREVSAYGWLYKKMTGGIAAVKDNNETVEHIASLAAQLTRRRKRLTRLLYRSLIPGAPEEPTLSGLIDLLPVNEQSPWLRMQAHLKNTYARVGSCLSSARNPATLDKGYRLRPLNRQPITTEISER